MDWETEGDKYFENFKVWTSHFGGLARIKLGGLWFV